VLFIYIGIEREIVQRLIEKEKERDRIDYSISFYIIGTCCDGKLSVHVLHDHLHFKRKEHFFTYNDLKPMNFEREGEREVYTVEAKIHEIRKGEDTRICVCLYILEKHKGARTHSHLFLV